MTDTIDHNAAPQDSTAHNSKSDISSLLPPAEVQIFTGDAETLALTEQASKDWRFARVQIECKGDSLEQALNFYEDNASPDLIIIQTDRTDDILEQGLEKLSEHCQEGTAAIIIGPVNDVRLYRNLMSMGISDYLVAPIPLNDFISAVGHVLQDLKGTLGSQLISVIGTKGGVGTSTMTQLIAMSLSETLQQKTLLLDAAAGHSTLWSLFDFKPSRTIIEAAKAAVDRDNEELNQLLIEANEHLSVMNSGAERLLDNPVSIQAYNMLLDRMLYLFPYVVIDLSCAPSLVQREILSRSESIFVVSTPTVTSLSLCRSLKKEIEDLRGGENAPLTLISNKQGEVSNAEVPEKDIGDMINLAPERLISMPYDAKFFLGLESEGTAIQTTKTGQDHIQGFADILTKDLHISPAKQSQSKDKSSGLGGLLGGLLKGKND